jgi:hypothetical protein
VDDDRDRGRGQAPEKKWLKKGHLEENWKWDFGSGKLEVGSWEIEIRIYFLPFLGKRAVRNPRRTSS